MRPKGVRLRDPPPLDVFGSFPNCKKKYSLRKKTILSFASISIRKFILLVYTFISCLWTYQQVKTEVNVTSSDDEESEDKDKESKHVALLSDKTISRFYTIFR